MPQGASESLPAVRQPRGRRLKRWVLRGILLLVVLVVTAELFARFCLGLGDPPLSIADPEMEYLFKPNQRCSRFGNRVVYNAYSMRCEDFPLKKTRPDEIRVLVVGDSVVNGGSLTDQADLATSRLRDALHAELHAPVIVANVSAGGWGPPNELAYVRRYGFFDAAVVVLVLSSHDYADAPTFEPVVGIHPSFPDRKPLSALQEGITRYLPLYLPRRKEEGAAPSPSTSPQRDIDWCLRAEREFFLLAKASGAEVLLTQHLTTSELGGRQQPGHRLIKDVAEKERIPVIQLGPVFEAARAAGQEPYRDDIHPNSFGQKLMADALKGPVEQALHDHAKQPE